MRINTAISWDLCWLSAVKKKNKKQEITALWDRRGSKASSSLHHTAANSKNTYSLKVKQRETLQKRGEVNKTRFIQGFFRSIWNPWLGAQSNHFLLTVQSLWAVWVGHTLHAPSNQMSFDTIVFCNNKPLSSLQDWECLRMLRLEDMQSIAIAYNFLKNSIKSAQ